MSQAYVTANSSFQNRGEIGSKLVVSRPQADYIDHVVLMVSERVCYVHL